MIDKIKNFFKVNKEGMIIGGIVGAIAYFIWRGFVPKQMSILQSSLSPQGLIDKLGVNLEIKTFLFFVFIGISIGLIVDMLYKPNR